MAEYVSALHAILPSYERERLEKLLSVGPEDQQSITEEQVIEILEKAMRGELSFFPRMQSGQTDSASFYANLREVLADLSLLYEQSKQVGQALSGHFSLHSGLLEQLEKAIARVERRIEDISVLADGNAAYSFASTESFLDDSMAQMDREGNETLFVDYTGSAVGDLARIHEGDLFLSHQEQVNVLHDENGETTATIEVLEQSGRAYRDGNPLYSPHSAIDGSPDTHWSEAILSPSVLRMPTAGIDSGAISRLLIRFARPARISTFVIDPVSVYPMELVSLEAVVGEGAYVPILPSLSSKPVVIKERTALRFPAVSASGLVFTLRQNHADRLVYSMTKETAANREMWQKLLAAERGLAEESIFEDTDPDLSRRLEEEGMTDPVWQAYLETARKYASDKKNHDLLGILGAGAFMALLGGHPLTALVTAAGLWQESHPTPPQAPEVVQAERYFYLYGARSIEVYGTTYSPASIYVSKAFFVEGNAKEFALEADEEHPLVLSSSGDVLQSQGYSNGAIVSLNKPLRRTSVEYYIAPVSDEHVYRWLPVLPLGQNEVRSEFLRMSAGSFGGPVSAVASAYSPTRFPVDDSKPVHLYRDEHPLAPDYWRIEHTSEGSFVVLDPRLFYSSSTYSIDYYPSGSYSLVDIGDAGVEPRQKTEYFEGAERNGRIVLSNFPYVDRQRLLLDEQANQITYNPVRIVLNPSDHPRRNADIHRIMGANRAIVDPVLSTRDPRSLQDNPARLLNITRYGEETLPLLSPYDPLGNPPTFEYYHDGRIVQFSESFRHSSIDNPSSHGQAIIQATYDYLVSGVLVKIILRRSPVDPSLTPVVRRYSLRSRSLF